MDGTFDELLVLAAKQVNGRQKRIFIAAVCEKLCDGSARKTEERFGWGREAIAKGLLERSSEPEEEVRLPRGGVKPSEVRNPQLAIDIRLMVDPHTHSDPELKSTLSQQMQSNRAMLVIVAEKVERSLADMLASRSNVCLAYDLERHASKHCSRGRKLPDWCHSAKKRNERDQQANHSLGKTAVIRYTRSAKRPRGW